MPSFLALDAPLTDGVVALRLSAERDIPEILIAYQDDRELPGALGEQRPPSGAALGTRSERAQHAMEAGEGVVFAILAAGDDLCLGEVRVSEVDWSDGSARLTVWVARGSRGQGFGGRAASLARGWLRDSCGLDAICSGSG